VYESPAGTVMNESSTNNHVSLDNLQLLFTKETPRDPPQFYVKSFSEVPPPGSRQVQC
jgi:hypothetical protein